MAFHSGPALAAVNETIRVEGREQKDPAPIDAKLLFLYEKLL